MGILSSDKFCPASCEKNAVGRGSPSSHCWTHLLEEGVGEGLNPELERSEIWRLVKSLHLFGHQGLVDRLAFGIRGVHYMESTKERKKKREFILSVWTRAAL